MPYMNVLHITYWVVYADPYKNAFDDVIMSCDLLWIIDDRRIVVKAILLCIPKEYSDQNTQIPHGAIST